MVSEKPTAGRVERMRMGILRLVEYVAAILMAGIMLMMITDVVARYVFHRPIAASFELVEMAMQVMLYLCIAVAMARNDHIKVSLIDPLLARFPRLGWAIDRISQVGIVVILGFLGLAVIELAQGKAGEVTAVLGFPVAPVAWVIGLALCLSALLSAWAAVQQLTTHDEDGHD